MREVRMESRMLAPWMCGHHGVVLVSISAQPFARTIWRPFITTGCISAQGRPSLKLIRPMRDFTAADAPFPSAPVVSRPTGRKWIPLALQKEATEPLTFLASAMEAETPGSTRSAEFCE